MGTVSFQKVNVTINTNNLNSFPSQTKGPWWLQLKQDIPSKKLHAVLTNDQNETFTIPSDHISFQKGVSQQKFLKWFESSAKIASLSKFCNIIQDERGFHASLSMPKLGLGGGNGEDEEAPVYFYKKEKSVDIWQVTKEKCFDQVRIRSIINSHPKLPNLHATPFFERNLNSCKLETECDITKELALLESGEVWSFPRYMHEALFNKHSGYYVDGRIAFDGETKSVAESDFSTHATKNIKPFLPYNIANQAAMMYAQMREAGDLEPGEPFIIHENAPGLGLMAFNILEFCLNNFSESSNPIHRDFWQALKYQAAEISPELVKKCRANNEYFIREGKYEIVQASAYNLTEAFPNKMKGLVLSNELIDTAPVGAIRLNSKNEVEALALAPCLEMEKAKLLLGDNVSERLSIAKDNETFVRLTPEDLQNLQEHMDIIQWEHNFFPIAAFPELVNHVKQYGIPYAENFQKGELIFLSTLAPSYMEQVSELLEKGFVMTIDYCLSGMRQDPSLRVFSKAYAKLEVTSEMGFITQRYIIPESNKPTHDLSFGMGKCDLTINVDFVPLIEAGKSHGLNSLATVNQFDLGNVLTNLDNPPFFNRPEDPSYGFFALIQQKSGTKAQFFIPAHSYNSEDILNKARMYSHVLDQFKKHSPRHDFEFFKACFEEMTQVRVEEQVAHFVYELGSFDSKEKNPDLNEYAAGLIKKYDEGLAPLLEQIVTESLV